MGGRGWGEFSRSTHISGLCFSHESLGVQLDPHSQDDAHPDTVLDCGKLDHDILLTLLEVRREAEVPAKVREEIRGKGQEGVGKSASPRKKRRWLRGNTIKLHSYTHQNRQTQNRYSIYIYSYDCTIYPLYVRKGVF